MIWPIKHTVLNICLGHKPFPEGCAEFVDIFLTPLPFEAKYRVMHIDDSYFGANGSSLSEYVQLMWLYDNFDSITRGYKYVHIFQYRRFVSPVLVGNPSDREFIRWISELELPAHGKYFSRRVGSELFNGTLELPSGAAWQYNRAHILGDFINFCKFLLENEILDADCVARLLCGKVMIPASNMGVFRVETLREVLAVLRRAAEFLHSSYFVPRVGYQRRSVGFLLERLNSFLILERIAAGKSQGNHGWHILISEGPTVSITTTL